MGERFAGYWNKFMTSTPSSDSSLPLDDNSMSATNRPSAESLRILYCHCSFANVVPKDVKEKVLAGLADSQTPVDFIPDLCEMSARRDPLLGELAKRSNVRIAACFPRAVQGLFTAAGCPLPPQGPEVVNMRVLSAEDVLSKLSRPETADANDARRSPEPQGTTEDTKAETPPNSDITQEDNEEDAAFASAGAPPRPPFDRQEDSP